MALHTTFAKVVPGKPVHPNAGTILLEDSGTSPWQGRCV
jgi:hypothetical protein